MAERFYINCPLAPGPVELSGPEAHHLAVVCRLRPGDHVCLFNGDGNEYPARVLSAERRRARLEISSVARPQRELGFALEVAAPLPKGDRSQFLIEKLTELGVTSFVPLETERSVIHPREGRLEKLQRYVIEASKQCGRNVLMRVGASTKWESYCRGGALPELKMLGVPGGLRVSRLPTGPEAGPACVLAVGPEGGFSTEEADMARCAGWVAVDLGPRILRIETAALVLASWMALARDGH